MIGIRRITRLAKNTKLMYSKTMKPGLVELFGIICGEQEEKPLFLRGNGGGQGDLFEVGTALEKPGFEYAEADIDLISALHSASSVNFSALPPHMHYFYELSLNAFQAIVHAWMSELHITAEIIGFGRKILAAVCAVAHEAASPNGEAMRQAAERAGLDRGDPVVFAVQAAAFKTWREIDRLRGLLRFSPDEDGVYRAFCEPDHFVLPALGPHFRERFGVTPWIVIDNRRRLCLHCEQGQVPTLSGMGKSQAFSGLGGEWEELWRRYHKSINNESRNKADLQRSFMPQRYWKYLTEM